ncbi:MAG: alpha/beta hydrolase [Patescibacteria group bacterium]|nr:alpha/beta hydrolase [Patescibacteria group bacterium]
MEATETSIESSKPQTEQLQGKETYDVEGTNITVSYNTFLPAETITPEDLTRAVLFIPGWSIPENAASLKPIGQELADYSKGRAFIVDTTTEKVAEGSLAQEAKALVEFAKKRGFKNLTLVGNSQGGAQVIHLAAILKEQHPQIQVEGIGLFDPVTLYEQGRGELFTNYVKDIIKTSAAITHPPKMKGRNEVLNQNMKYTKDGIVGILKGVMHARALGWPLKIWNEISEMAKANPNLAKIDVPVVIIQGAHDKVSNPAEIIPNQDPNSTKAYADKADEREEGLKNIFPNSPYVRLLVPEKMGYHNVSYSRPESSARTVLYMLERYKRQHLQPQST